MRAQPAAGAKAGGSKLLQQFKERLQGSRFRCARALTHRGFGAEAGEMAEAVVFLASDESSFVNASNFLVDGGVSGAYVTPLEDE